MILKYEDMLQGGLLQGGHWGGTHYKVEMASRLRQQVGGISMVDITLEGGVTTSKKVIAKGEGCDGRLQEMRPCKGRILVEDVKNEISKREDIAAEYLKK